MLFCKPVEIPSLPLSPSSANFTQHLGVFFGVKLDVFLPLTQALWH